MPTLTLIIMKSAGRSSVSRVHGKSTQKRKKTRSALEVWDSLPLRLDHSEVRNMILSKGAGATTQSLRQLLVCFKIADPKHFAGGGGGA